MTRRKLYRRVTKRRSAFLQGIGIGCGLYVAYFVAFIGFCAVILILTKTGACS